ncbi:MAG: T9SS type A sorting domain-containing protein [Flavobacteriales bacterium]|nr:T9SS type A sorting domain-containing protein [Flavobacteriales bacterium]
MKRTLPFLLALVVAFSVSSLLIKDATPTYEPRESLKSQALWSGAEEVRNNLLADPETGEIDYNMIYEVQQAMSKRPMNMGSKSNDLSWISAGPNNTGGRTRAVITYQEDPTKVLIGGVSGGLFRSNNSGEEWEAITSFNDNVAVSSIARTANGTIYVGTGNRYDTFVGNGLYQSTDDGATWSLLNDFTPAVTFATSADWAEVNRLMPDPIADNKVWIAYGGGLATYTEGDDDVELVLNVAGTYCSTFDVSSDGQRIIAVINNQVYISTNGGDTFEDRMSSDFGDIPAGNVGRVEVAISKDDSDFMYCIVANNSSYLRGFYASTDGGDTWYELYGDSNTGTLPFSPFAVGDGDLMQGQGIYDNVLSVVPGNPQRCIVGGIRVYDVQLQSVNPPSSQWSLLNINFSQGPNPLYVHSDIHAFHWDANDVFYIGTDGGIFKSSDYAQTFLPSNYEYRTTQFYGIDFNSVGSVIGGTQDNGTHIITGFNISPNDSDQPIGGDGFDCNLSKFDSEIGFGTLYFNRVSRTFDGGITGLDILTQAEYPGPFWTVIDLYETLEAPNAISQNFPWNEQFLELEESINYDGADYFIGDTIAFISEFCLDGVQYDDGDTLVVEEYRHYLAPGATHPYASESYEIPYVYTNDTGENLYEFCDMPPALDPAQSLFCVGGFNGFLITRDATKNTVGAGDIQWAEVSNISGTVTSFEFSPDGDKLYVGTSQGRMYRYSDLNTAYNAEDLEDVLEETGTIIYNGSGVVQDIAVDQNDPNRVAFARPGYANADKVFITNEAETTTVSNSFEPAWNLPEAINRMPAYSVLFDKNTPGRLLVGTEYGVWVTDNDGQSYEECNTNMGRVPVYALEQQVLTTSDLDLLPGEHEVLNEGAIYAGTFGKGIYYIGDYILGLDDVDHSLNDVIEGLKLYPNPAASEAQLQLDLAQTSNVILEIIDIQGRMVQSLPQGILQNGEQLLRFNVSDLSEGTYVLNVIADTRRETVTFVVKK